MKSSASRPSESSLRKFVLGFIEAPIILAVFLIVMWYRPRGAEEIERFWIVVALAFSAAAAFLLSNNGHKFFVRKDRLTRSDVCLECSGVIVFVVVAVIFAAYRSM